MKLFYSPFHDFAHKVLVVIHESGIQDRVELVASFPFRNLDGEWVSGQYDTSAIAPLARVPLLALDDGRVLYPSHVAVEYLDSLSDSPLLPGRGAARFDALRRLGLGDAMFDMAVQLSMESWRAPRDRREDLYLWLWPKLVRSAARLNEECSGWTRFDLGHTALLQALSYIGSWAGAREDIPHNAFRLWHERWPRLADWLAAALDRDSVRSHYRRSFDGDVSPERHATAIAEVLAARTCSDD